jgi:hypothetical protein
MQSIISSFAAWRFLGLFSFSPLLRRAVDTRFLKKLEVLVHQLAHILFVARQPLYGRYPEPLEIPTDDQ